MFTNECANANLTNIGCKRPRRECVGLHEKCNDVVRPEIITYLSCFCWLQNYVCCSSVFAAECVTCNISETIFIVWTAIQVGLMTKKISPPHRRCGYACYAYNKAPQGTPRQSIDWSWYLKTVTNGQQLISLSRVIPAWNPVALRPCVVRVFVKPLNFKWGFPHTYTDRSGVFAAHITLYGVIVFSSATKCDQSSQSPYCAVFAFGYYCCTHVTRLLLNMPRHLAYASQPNVLVPVSLNLLLSLIL